MKILYIEPCTQNFGGYFRSLEICRALSRAGIKVDLLISSDQKYFFKITRQKFDKNLTIFILPRLYFNFYITGRILRGIIASFFSLFGKYDIIQASSIVQLESNIPLSIAKLFGKNVVYSWEDIWTENNTGFNQYVRRYLEFWENHSPRIFKNVQCISQILINKAKNLGAVNTVKILNGTDPGYFCPAKKASLRKLKLDPKFKYLLIFGNTYGEQRLYLTLLTFKKILVLHPQTKLITNYDLKKLLTAFPHITKIYSETSKQIINTGYIPDNLLPYYQSASDATIFIMGNNLNEKACFPVRMSKFISAESIIIINENHSETTAVLKKYSCAIIDSDLDQLAQKTVDFFRDPKIRKKLHQGTVIAKKELSWDNLVLPLISFYEQIIQN